MITNDDGEKLSRLEFRMLVAKRARGKSEACGLRPPRILDHWLGGRGRRRQEESLATVWALCNECNIDRTDNRPSAAYWNAIFRVHCTRHGYEFVPHKELTQQPQEG